MPDGCDEYLKTRKCVIAYLDILGTKNRIMDNDSLVKIDYIYQIAMKSINRRTLDNLKVKIFSDNILASVEISDDMNDIKIIEEVDDILHFVEYFQSASHLIANWCLRGGITIGELYHSNLYVWGEGLNRAYKLESTIAKYPRVIIDLDSPELVTYANLASSIIATDGSNSKAYPIPIAMDDEDGMLFVSYEEAKDESGNLLFISQIHDSIINQINTESHLWKTDENILKKLKWMVSYHNKICNKYSMKEYLIPSSIFNVVN